MITSNQPHEPIYDQGVFMHCYKGQRVCSKPHYSYQFTGKIIGARFDYTYYNGAPIYVVKMDNGAILTVEVNDAKLVDEWSY